MLAVTLTGEEWAAVIVRLMIGRSITEASAGVYQVAKAKIARQVMDAIRSAL